MKRIKIYFLCTVIFLCTVLGGCAGKETGNGDKLSVVTTIFASYDFVRQIAKDRAQITLLLKLGAEAHSYEPTPKDIITIEKCDVFIYVGGENDAWVDRILSSIDTSGVTLVKLLDCVEKYQEEIVEGMQSHEGHSHGEDEECDEEHEEEEWDEHVWTDPENAIAICEEITAALSGKSDNDKEFFQNNFNDYKKELEELDNDFTKLIEESNRKEIIFGDRFPLRYFTEAYGLKYYAAFPGCAAESEASAKTIAFLIDKVKEDEIPVIFKIELSNGNIAETVSKDTGAKVCTFQTCHNVTKEDFDNQETYVSLMRKNLSVLKEALQ